MKRYSVLFFALVIGCNNPEQTADFTVATAQPAIPESPQAKLNNRLEQLDVPLQVFTAPHDQLSMITGKKGTVVFVAPEELETEGGGKPEQSIVVELKELTSQGDLMRANAATVSNGNLLVSGGAYYLNMTSGGKKLRIKKDKTLKVAFPKITESSMSLFYGVRDSAGNMNWQPTGQKLTSANGYSVDTTDARSIMVYNERDYQLMGYVGNDSATFRKDTAMLNAKRRTAIAARRERRRLADSVNFVEGRVNDSMLFERYKVSNKLNSTLYDISGINKMGWMNVDRLPGLRSESCTYTIAPQDSILYARVYLAYKDINAALTSTFYAMDGMDTRSFGTIPIGYKARLLAVAYRKGQLLTCRMDFTTAADQHTLIVWKPTPEAELNRLFDPADN